MSRRNTVTADQLTSGTRVLFEGSMAIVVNCWPVDPCHGDLMWVELNDGRAGGVPSNELFELVA